MKKIISLLPVALVLVFALTACGVNKNLVATDGSTSFNKVIGILGEAFEADTGITVTYNATGSGAGIQAVQEGRCHMGLSSRNLRLENGDVLRISVSQVTVGALILGMLPAICAIVIISVIVALVMSKRMATSIVKPLNELDLDHPTNNNAYEELAPILTKLSKQHNQIESQLALLREKSDQLDQITSSMKEGLVLLDSKGYVLSMNAAAKRLFDIEHTPVGCDFLTVDRSTNMSRAIKKAFDGKHSVFYETRNKNEYQFILNRPHSDGKTIGLVILCLDVTETAFAQRNRREFTANVSHELKTPLQSIIGSTELLESGLVKPEDTARFVGNIKNEATRLVSLINDIIHLSQLDEDTEMATESVNLLEVANEVAEMLSEAAAKRKVKISVRGESCYINGVQRYLYEIIYNLCDNAIRYNKENGKVEINVKKDGDNTVLSVSDTGIGIPPEHHSRIFERFYRVDKSHSKETGGTGLGLSIVKHAVAYHKGKLRIDSTPNEGTTITVLF